MKKVFKMVNLTVATAVMSLAFVGHSFAASSTDFTDLTNVAAKDKIISLQQSGIISGVAPGLFAPNAPLTEAQSVQLFVSTLGLNLDAVRFEKELKATDYFTNADDKAWYAASFITAAVHNLDLPKSLDPNQSKNKEEFTHQLIRAIERIGHLPMIKPVLVDMKDKDQVSEEYSGSIQRALSYGIVKLNADGTFNPKQIMTREQAAEEIFNAIQYLKAHSNNSASEIMTASQGVKLIAELLGKDGTDIQIKIDPDAKMTRESFINLLMQTLKTSGKLPMINIQPIDIKDNDQIDVEYSGSVQLAIVLGFINLSDEGTINPKGELTRTVATEIIGKASEYLKAHQKPSVAVSYGEGAQLISKALDLAGSDIAIKVDPNAIMTRESFVSLLVQTLKSSGKLPMIKPVVIDIKDLDKVDSSNKSYVQLAASLGIVKLSDENLFKPKDELSQTDAAEIVNNVKAVVERFPSSK
ncbi:S-layer homology domain-containing protein [Paenibacillus hamazuiensis]|uniref:S-layer homology domain-containing protein n=1 Tax=Paenibacillus hamazuiensis TaxID=2936508 RepID=UPI00200FE330|nr:S-layer homology domain-containing protein [Paenibacillus hamazuiensis]